MEWRGNVARDKQLQSAGFTLGTMDMFARTRRSDHWLSVRGDIGSKDVWSNADTFLQGEWKGKTAKTKQGSQQITWINHSHSEESVLNTVRALLSRDIEKAEGLALGVERNGSLERHRGN